MKMSDTLTGFKIAKIADGYSEYTLSAYISALRILTDYLGDPEIEDVTGDDLASFMAYLRTDYKPSTWSDKEGELSNASLHRYHKAIRSYFTWLAEDFKLPRIDEDLKTPRYQHKEVIPYNEREITDLINACEYSKTVYQTHRKNYAFRRDTATRDKSMLLFLLDTGVRIGEFCRLEVRDVNMENGEVRIKPYHVRKTKARTVFIGKTTRRVLWKYLAERNALPDDPLFVTRDEYKVTRHSVGSILRNLGERANVEKVHPHRFRHTFAIQYLRNGGDIFTLQRLLGHSTLQMVRYYLNIAQSDDQDAHRRASPVDRWKL